jgi:hypothetical protein
VFVGLAQVLNWPRLLLLARHASKPNCPIPTCLQRALEYAATTTSSCSRVERVGAEWDFHLEKVDRGLHEVQLQDQCQYQHERRKRRQLRRESNNKYVVCGLSKASQSHNQQ